MLHIEHIMLHVCYGQILNVMKLWLIPNKLAKILVKSLKIPNIIGQNKKNSTSYPKLE